MLNKKAEFLQRISSGSYTLLQSNQILLDSNIDCLAANQVYLTETIEVPETHQPFPPNDQEAWLLFQDIFESHAPYEVQLLRNSSLERQLVERDLVEHVVPQASDPLPDKSCAICLDMEADHLCVQCEKVFACLGCVTYLKSLPNPSCPMCRATWIGAFKGGAMRVIPV